MNTSNTKAPRQQALLAALILTLLGAVVYHASFSGSFILDDIYSIVKNPNIKKLVPIWEAMARPPAEGAPIRPLVYFTFALSYALGGLKVWGYHALNLAVHIIASLLLFGIVRRTLLLEKFRCRFSKSAFWIALSTSLLWMVHPLQTESVTYIVQRAEAMMGLFYLLTIWCVIRASASDHANRWYAAGILACACGMVTKPVMVTVPLMVLLYDGIFLTPSYSESLKKRKVFYISLAATWLIVLAIILLTAGEAEPTVGFRYKEFTGRHPIWYALSQPGVLLHYLRLSFWPHPLCLDYMWMPAQSIKSVIVPVIIIVSCLALVIKCLRTRSPLGFLGAWFFLILAPTSSFIPIKDLAAEHRMYLPLAAVIAGAVLTGCSVISKSFSKRNLRSTCSWLLVIGISSTFGYLTHRRNLVYQNEISVWSDVIAKRPDNYRGHFSLGRAFYNEGDLKNAVFYCSRAIELEPGYTWAYNILGLALAEQGRTKEAIAAYREAVRLKPSFAEPHNNLGVLLAGEGNLAEAKTCFNLAIEYKSGFVDPHTNLGNIFLVQGKFKEAIALYERSVEVDPGSADPYGNLGLAMTKQGLFDKAIPYYKKAIEVDPSSAVVFNRLGYALGAIGKYNEAVRHFREALRIDPNYKEANENLEKALKRVQ